MSVTDDDVETDRRCLEAVADAINLSTTSHLCPDIDALAREDRPLAEKIVRFRELVIVNVRDCCNGRVDLDGRRRDGRDGRGPTGRRG